MPSPATTLEYRLARTVVKVDGTVSIDTGKDGKPVPTRTNTVTLDVEADHDVALRTVKLNDRWWADSEFTMSLAADGRLSGTSQKSTGLGGKVISGGLKLFSAVAKLSPVSLEAAPADVRAIKTIDTILHAEQPDLLRRRAAYADALSRLQDRLAAVSGALADSTTADPDLCGQLEALQIALTATHSEAATIEAQYEVWHAKRFPTWTQTHSYLIGTDQLLQRRSVTAVLTLTDAEKITLHHAIDAALQTFGVLVVCVSAHRETSSAPATDNKSVVYRQPDRIVLAVYEAQVTGNALPTRESRFKLKAVVPAWVIDARSEHRSVRLRTSWFRKRATTTTFGKTGTLSKVSRSVSGSQLVSALGSAAGDVADGLGDAEKIGKAFPEPADPALTALKAKVASKELEARLAKANKTIAGAGGTGPS